MWTICFDNFADGSTSNAISASLSLACLTFRHTEFIFWHQNDVSSSCHVVFSPRNSNNIFEGKIAQLWRLVKSLILTLNISNFGIVYFKRYILNMWKKNSLHSHFNTQVSQYFKILCQWEYKGIWLFVDFILKLKCSTFSTLRIFHTPPFSHSALSTLRTFLTPHS